MFGAGIARGASTGGAIGNVTALVAGGVAATRASGVAWDNAETAVTVCAGDEGVTEPCATAPALVVGSFGEIAATAFACTIGATGCATAGALAVAAGDTTGLGGVRAGTCEDATIVVLLARLDASVGCARDAAAPAEVD